jgi:hypothetical protein
MSFWFFALRGSLPILTAMRALLCSSTPRLVAAKNSLSLLPVLLLFKGFRQQSGQWEKAWEKEEKQVVSYFYQSSMDTT